MQRYEQFPEIFAIHQRIMATQKKLAKNERMIKEVKIKNYEFNGVVKRTVKRYRSQYHEQVRKIKSKFKDQLLIAKYAYKDIDALYATYHEDLVKAEKEYEIVLNQKLATQDEEYKILQKSLSICWDENRQLKTQFFNDSKKLKEDWKALKEVRTQNNVRLKKEYTYIKEQYDGNVNEIKRLRHEQRKNVYISFKSAYPDVKMVKAKIFSQKIFKLKSFKSDSERELYKTYLELNAINLRATKDKLIEKQKIKEAHLKFRYNRGLPDPMSTKSIVNSFVSTTEKISNWKFIAAIRNGFFVMLPFVLIQSFCLLISNIILSPTDGGMLNMFYWTADQLSTIANIRNIFDFISNGSSGFFGLILSAAIGFYLARHYKINEIVASITAVTAMLVMDPILFTGVTDTSIANIGSNGLFVAIICSITTSMALNKLTTYRKLNIKVPDSLPNGIIRTFRYLFPMAITLLFIGMISAGIFVLGQSIGPIQIYSGKEITIQTFQDAIEVLFSKPLVHATEGYAPMQVELFAWQMLWLLGIHPNGVIGPIMVDIQWNALLHNIQITEGKAFGEQVIYTNPFMNSFQQFGGTGGTLALIFVVIIFSKRKDYKTIAWVSLFPGLFGINEPIVYGLPLVFNPIMALPFVFGPLIWGSFAYLMTYTGVLNHANGALPWTTPPFINAVLSTHDWDAVWIWIICFGMAFGMYTPFVLMLNKSEKRHVIDAAKEEAVGPMPTSMHNNHQSHRPLVFK